MTILSAMPRTRHQSGWITRENGKYYGHYRRYVIDPETKQEKWKHEMFVIGPVSRITKGEAKQQLRMEIGKQLGVEQKSGPDPNTPIRTFVQTRYFPLKRGVWGQAWREQAEYEIEHYILAPMESKTVAQFNDKFCLQVYLNGLAKTYSQSVVRHVRAHISGILAEAEDQKYIEASVAHKLEAPATKLVKKPLISRAWVLKLIDSLEDPRDRALMYIGVFCPIRTSEAFGLTWGAYDGEKILIKTTAYKGKLYERVKTAESKNYVHVPEAIRPFIERWRKLSKDTSPDALMFPSGRVMKKNAQPSPMWPKNFMYRRIWPVTDTLEIPRKAVTFQVLRRTVGTELQKHGTMKDVQAAMRHRNIGTTADIYVQEIPESVKEAMESRTDEIFRELAKKRRGKKVVGIAIGC